MEQMSVMPNWFFLIAIALLIVVAVGLARRNSQAARNGGVAAAALAIGVLAMGWIFVRRHGVAVVHSAAQYPHAVAQEMSKGWLVVLILGALVAGAVFIFRCPSSQTRSLLLAGGGVFLVLALVFGAHFESSEYPATATVWEAPQPPVLDQRVAPPQTQPPKGRKSSSKARRSKSTPVVSKAAEAPVQPSAQPSTKPKPPEPSDDHVASTSPPASESAPAAAQPSGATPSDTGTKTPPAAETATKSVPLADEHTRDAEPDNRPAWVDSKGEFAADGTYYAVIHTPPKLTLRDALREVDPRMRTEAQQFVDSLTPQGRYYRWFHGLRWDTIVRRAEKERYVETLHSRFADADTKVVHVRMAFTPQLQQEIWRMIQDVVLWQRTALLVLIAGFVLATIGIVYSYLRLDTATKGYYTWRLRFLAVALSLGAFAGLCGMIEELNLDDAFETIDWQPVAQAQSGRLR